MILNIEIYIHRKLNQKNIIILYINTNIFLKLILNIDIINNCNNAVNVSKFMNI